MPFHVLDGIKFFNFESLNRANVTHAIFTRRGGFSPKPWESLNMGGLVGDHPDNVKKNRELAFQAIGRDPESIYDVWQVHSDKVVCVYSPRPYKLPYQKADAILTNNPNVTLFMRFADCVPIFLFDKELRVVGLVHSGWQGTVKRIAIAAVQTMVDNYGSNLNNIWAGIGPSICVDHYEINSIVAERVREVFGYKYNSVLVEEENCVKLNLWEANKTLLLQAGINLIELSNLCTACHLNDWYSHRGENGKTGRFGALIGLNDNSGFTYRVKKFDS